jgi:voltage-gated sodium channel
METLRTFIQDKRVERAVIILIVINAITLGLETSQTVMSRWGTLLHTVDQIILWIFVAELLIRMVVYRFAFFKDPWSLFDLFVVAIALIPATGSLSVLRALRILRILRLITAVPSLRKVVAGLISAMPGMGSIGLLLVIIFYVFAVMGTKLYGGTNPELFGHLGATAYTLFQAMTFDDWSGGIVKPLAEQGHGHGWFFVMAFMVVSVFVVLNLFIGVVVTALDEVTSEGKPKPVPADVVLAELRALRAEVAALRAERTPGGQAG